MRRLAAAIAAAFLTIAFAGPVAASSSDQHAVHYYLSLGDSLAAGVQPTGDPADMYRTSDGYADQLYVMAKDHFPKLQLVKLGCPGETTATMIDGGICSYEDGSQLAAALEFLHAHARHTSLITIDIGWNDVAPAEACILQGLAAPETCIKPGIDSIAEHLPGILAALAAEAPGVPIVAMNMYDPFLAYWLAGSDGKQLAYLSVNLLVGINGLEEQIYTAAGIPVAGVQAAFFTTDFTPVAPSGLPHNVATICAWTWKCSVGDNHANHDGYHAIALAFAHELGWT